MKIGIIEYPGPQINAGNITPLKNLIRLIEPGSEKLSVILSLDSFNYHKSNKNLLLYPINNCNFNNPLLRILFYMYMQIKISIILFKIRKDIDLCLFFIGGDTLIIPSILLKMLQKKIIISFAGSSILTYKTKNDNLYIFLNILSKINCMLCNKIIVYSKNLIKEWKLINFEKKIDFGHEHILDFNSFKISKEFFKRKKIIGFVGRFTEEKGIMNLIHAIPYIKKINTNIKFNIAGNGPLFDLIKEFINHNDLSENVKLVGWLDYCELPSFLNDCRLLIIPSFTEGLPNIMIESMACGTPVLANNVGCIPDFIINNNTGYLMKNNSKESIIENINYLINSNQSNLSIDLARENILKNFSYKASYEKYWKIINSLVVE